MKFYVAAAVAFAGSAIAAEAGSPSLLNEGYVVEEGKPFTIKYSGCEGGCTIILQNGPSDDTKDVEVLTSEAEGSTGTFTFTPSGLPSDTYNIKIRNNDTGKENYSLQFEYEGTGAAPTKDSTTKEEETTTAEPTKETKTVTDSATETEAESTTEEATTFSSVTTSAKTSVKETSTTPEPKTIHTPEVTSKNATTTPVPTKTKTTSKKTTSKTEEASTTTEEESSETSAETTGGASTVPDSAAVRMTSSLALVAVAVMAFVYLN